MSVFTRHIGAFLVATEGGIRYRLHDDLVWRIGHVDGPEYRIPAGYIFDVSVPKSLRWLFNPHDSRFHKAACVHDHMLEAGWSRITAGAEFHDALKAGRLPAWRRALMLAAVLAWRFD